MRKILKFLGLLKLIYYKTIGIKLEFDYTVFFHPKAKIVCYGKNGKIILGKKTNIMKNVDIIIGDESTLIVKDKVVILKNTHIELGKKAETILNKETFINKDCKLVAMEKICIGENVAIGPNVMFFDNDHIVKKDIKQNWDEFKSDNIIVEDNVWIGANSIILRRSHIGHNSVIAASSVIKEKIPCNVICYNKKEMLYKQIN